MCTQLDCCPAQLRWDWPRKWALWNWFCAQILSGVLLNCEFIWAQSSECASLALKYFSLLASFSFPAPRPLQPTLFLIQMLNKYVQIKNNSHFSLNTCSVLNRDYLGSWSWLSSSFRSQVAERGPHVCTGTAAVPWGAMLLQLNPVMLLIAHHSVECVCLSLCAYNAWIHPHSEGTVDRIYHIPLRHKKIEITPGLYDANLLHGNRVLPETYEVIKHETS